MGGTASCLLSQRDLRERFFSGIDEPAWTMLLILWDAESRHRKLIVSNLCSGCHAPYTTALRRLGSLEARGLVERIPCEHDGRRIFVRLTILAREKLEAFSAAQTRLAA